MMVVNNRYCALSIMGLSVLILTGCAPKKVMLEGDSLVAHGHYKEAATLYSKHIDKDDRTHRNNLLWYLNSGLAYRFDENNSASIGAFDESEWLIKHYQTQLLNADVGQGAASILVNDTTRPYIGTQYDGVMANTYKAIDYLAMGEADSARVEFNRAIDRQRRAKEFYAKLIAKNREAIAAQERADNKGVNSEGSLPVAEHALQEKYPSLYNFKAYPDFINPMVSYLAGIFALSQGDNPKAFDLLKEAYGMNQDNTYIAQDLSFVDALLDGKVREQEPLVWVIIEDGLAPVKREWRMDIPIWIASNNLNYVSLALPRIDKRKAAYSFYSAMSDTVAFKSRELSDMDRVIMTEFKHEYPAIVRRAIFSATTKAVIQYEMQHQANNNNDGKTGVAFALASLAVTAYTIASTQADTRIWTTLPKRFELLRLQRPSDGKLIIKTSSGLSFPAIDIALNRYTLVYVKMPSAGAKPSITVIPLRR